MARRAPAVLATLAALVAVGLTACSNDTEPAGPTDPPAPSTAPSSDPATTPSTPDTDTDTDTGLPPGGTAAQPAAVEPAEDLLDWQPVDADPEDTTVTMTATERVSVDREGRTATVGDDRLAAPRGFRWNDVVTNGRVVVLNAQDRAEEQPSRATVITLADRTRRTLDGTSTPPTVNGGAWAVDDTAVHHATSAGGRYCLASVPLADLRGRTTYCAPAGAGFSDVVSGPDGTSLLTFGGQPRPGRPQCRTPARLDGTAAVPLEGVTRCAGWDSALLPDGAVWSVVPKPRQVETARFLARAGDAYYDLGPGSTGTLARCGSAAYFTRDSDADDGRAEVLRWSPDDGLAVVYASPGRGQAFVAEPRCAGDRLTLSAFGEGGDEQVWARVG